jgi:hypothetical protein
VVEAVREDRPLCLRASSASRLAWRYGRISSAAPATSWVPIEETITNRVTPRALAASIDLTAAP